jgi:hypothetical protein
MIERDMVKRSWHKANQVFSLVGMRTQPCEMDYLTSMSYLDSDQLLAILSPSRLPPALLLMGHGNPAWLHQDDEETASWVRASSWDRLRYRPDLKSHHLSIALRHSHWLHTCRRPHCAVQIHRVPLMSHLRG